MANALSIQTPPPPPVKADEPAVQQPAAPLAQAPMPQMRSALVPQAPAPDHGQTVAALRHFHAIKQELQGLWNDPQLGKSDLKSKIIDGATKLVANRIMPPSQAVAQLGNVPSDPAAQKKWVSNHLQQIMLARDAVLDHHRAAFAGMPENLIAATSSKSTPDSHMADLDGMMASHYARH
jgi:hypothetical protein